MLITLRKTDGDRPLVDADWYAFCQAIYKGIEGSEWEERDDFHYREMSKAAGSQKAERESQKKQKPCGP